MILALAAGCSVGRGSPDGWRYLRGGPVAVAHPNTWQETATGAVLRGPDGRTDAALTVTPVASGALGSPPARARTLTIDGRTAEVYGYDQPTADGRAAGHVEVRTQDRAGHPVLVSAWAVDHGSDSALLREIVNSIEFSRS